MRATFQRFVAAFEVLLQLLDSNYMGGDSSWHIQEQLMALDPGEGDLCLM